MSKTVNSILCDVCDEYIASLDIHKSKTPYDMEIDIMSAVKDVIELENASRNRDEHKLRIPDCLPNFIITKLLLGLYDIRRITWQSSVDTDNYVLGIYQDSGERNGLYITNTSVFSNLIREYNCRIDEKGVKDVLSRLMDLAPVCRPNSDKNLIAVNNGIFDYETKKLMPFSPDYIFLSKSAVDYTDNARNVVIHNDDDNTDWDVESWVDDLSDDNEITALLWQIIGGVIRPNVSWGKCVCFYSEVGNNGKGTLCSLMRNLCGERSHTSITFANFSNDYLLAPLVSASAVITDENSTGAYIQNNGPFKAAVTGDVINVNRKYKDPIELRFKGLIVECINDMPRFADKSDSFYRRLLIIPFEKSFTGAERKYIKDDYLKRKEVLEYVLWKVLNMNYYEFDNPQACEDLLNEYKMSNDPVRQFLFEILPQCQWDLIPYAFLYDLYRVWFKLNCPSGVMLNALKFKQQVMAVLINDENWFAANKPVHVNGRMDKPEPLILSYGLTNWQNDSYRGNDPDQICVTCKKDSNTQRGLTRVTTVTLSGDAVVEGID